LVFYDYLISYGSSSYISYIFVFIRLYNNCYMIQFRLSYISKLWYDYFYFELCIDDIFLSDSYDNFYILFVLRLFI